MEPGMLEHDAVIWRAETVGVYGPQCASRQPVLFRISPLPDLVDGGMTTSRSEERTGGKESPNVRNSRRQREGGLTERGEV